MSKPTTYYLTPAPAMVQHQGHTKVRLCPFPKTQRRGRKRYLHPDGEPVVCRTSEERHWWMSMVRSGDCIQATGEGANKIEAAAKARVKATEDHSTAKAAAKKAVDEAKGDEAKASAEKALAEIKKPEAGVPWGGPDPVDKGHENVPELEDRGPSKGGKKGK